MNLKALSGKKISSIKRHADNTFPVLKEYKDNYTEVQDNQAWFENLKVLANKHLFVDNKLYKQNPEQFAGSVSDAAKFVRLAITGSENSPELFSIMKILGVDECKNRIINLIQIIQREV